MSRWYLVHTKRAGEAVAEANLQRQGYKVYLPRLAQAVRRRGRWQDRIVALFPRYLFLGLNEGSQTLGPVRSTVGVSNVVRFGLRYANVPDELIDALRTTEDPESGLHRMRVSSLPEPGAMVKIADGPFSGLEGVFEREFGGDRVLVLLNLLGQSTPVQVPIDCIVPTVPA